MICLVRKIGLVCLRSPNPVYLYFKQPYHTISFLISPSFILALRCTTAICSNSINNIIRYFPTLTRWKSPTGEFDCFRTILKKGECPWKDFCQVTKAHWRYNTGLPISKDLTAGNSCNQGCFLLPWLICRDTSHFFVPTGGTGKICLTGFGESRETAYVQEHWEPPCVYTCRKTVLICLVLIVSR